MNEEQKEFINELLKDSNINHGIKKSKVSKSKVNPYHLDLETNYKYKGKPAIYNKLFDFIRPTTNKGKDLVKKILEEILVKNTYNEFLNWKETNNYYTKENFYTKKLFNVVMKLIEENEPNKYYDVFRNQILDRSLTIDDLKTPKNNDKSSTIDEDKSLKNDDKPFNPDEEILIENDEKSLTADDDKSNKSEDKLVLKIDKLRAKADESLKKIDQLEQIQSLNDEIEKNKNNLEATKKEQELLKNNTSDISEDKLDTEDVENTNSKPESIPETPVKPIISTTPDLSYKEQELFKNIELALSYKYNKEYQDNNVLEFEGKNGKIYKHEKPYKKFKALLHQKIADYIEELHFKYGHKPSEFIKLKQEIIDKINERYFGEDNEYGFRVYNKDANNRAFEIKDLEDSKLKRRAEKNYVNQNAPNKYVFFKYSMKDIYDIIEEYFEINLSVHSKSLIESIVSSSVDKYIDNADKLGQISYNTIAHGIKNDVIKLIEKYINSKRNIHIKMKFEFDSDSRSKLMEIINREIDRNKNDFKQKSKNILSFIDHLKFF